MRGKKYLNKSQHCYTRQGRDHIHVNNAYQQIYLCCKPLFIFHKISTSDRHPRYKALHLLKNGGMCVKQCTHMYKYKLKRLIV